MLAVERRARNCATEVWSDWSGEVGPGHFWADLTEARAKLHAMGICPRVSMAPTGDLRALY